jgi:hypothetical protein
MRHACLSARNRQEMAAAATCRECGALLQARRAGCEFCNAVCRQRFNNRRAVRGADLYDVVMSLRVDRGKSGAALSLLSKMVSNFRDIDRREREGRRSWLDLNTIISRNGHLRSAVVGLNVAGVRSLPRREAKRG